MFDLLNILILFIGNDFPNLFYHQPQQINSDEDNVSTYSFYYRLILLICKVEVGQYIDIGAFRKPQKTVGEQSSGSRTEYVIEDAGERVKRSINDLFDSKDFKEVRDQLIKLLPSEDQPQPDVYIRYDDPMLAMLPLHLWDEFQSRNIEPVFCSLKTSVHNQLLKKKQKPRILLILGDFVDIKNDNDKVNWQDFYPDAEIKVLEMLNAKGISDALWKEKWDVLYFGGHSTTQERKGILYLKDDVSITLGNFRKGLVRAAENGLQLAIFNSCISLGAAADLQSAGIPMVIATRHLMHNLIAPEFLELFLDAYINDDRSIKEAVWYARERLKTDSNYFPCADFLPVVFQIPTATIQPKASPLVAIATSFFVTCLVFFLHTQGIFQAAELSLYDHMMNSRRAEPLDSRIVIVQTTNKDRKFQEKEGNKLQGQETINDRDLLKLLNKLDEVKPRVIGMAYWRGYSTSNYPEIKALVDKRIVNSQPPILVSNCSSPPNDTEIPSLPPELMLKGHPHIGFTNISSDINFGDTTRRMLLIHEAKNSECSKYTQVSFPLQIVFEYFGIDKNKEEDLKFEGSGGHLSIKINNPITQKFITISGIQKGQGGYQNTNIENHTGFAEEISILFNYKNHSDVYPDMDKVPILSLNDVISGDHDNLMKDKIVIIGGKGIDSILMHSSKSNIKRIDGLFIHAQAVDYLLRIIETNKLLIGMNSDIFLFYFFVMYILLNSTIVNYISSIHKEIKSILLCLSTILMFSIVYSLHLWILENKLIWIPSVPIFLGFILSAIAVSSPLLTKFSYNLLKNI